MNKPTGMEVSTQQIKMTEDSDQFNLIKQGAEAKIYTGTLYNKPCIVKERFSKAYRHPVLDKNLTMQRTKSEVRSMMRCRMIGIQTPAIYLVDLEQHKIYMEYIHDGVTVKDFITQTHKEMTAEAVDALKPIGSKIGMTLGLMHQKNIIHGDLTTSNMLLRKAASEDADMTLYLIDFGLGYIESVAEDKGVDLYVLERALLSTHPNTEDLFEVILESYCKAYGKGSQEVISKLNEVRMRGRKRTMVG